MQRPAPDPAPDYELLAAVQDLYTWYLRSRSTAAAGEMQRADYLIRGSACLLGNHLAEAARPLLLELAALIAAFRPSAGEAAASEPSSEIDALRTRIEVQPLLDEPTAYALFGELLALYLQSRGLDPAQR